MALYDPYGGFFSRPGRGAGTDPGSDFVTSPEMSPLFGELLVDHVDAMWRAMGSPNSLDVIEVGSGRGSLAESFLTSARHRVWCEALNFQMIEYADPELPSRVQGVIVANELLDNIPGDLEIATGEGWCELLVSVRGDDLAFLVGGPVEAKDAIVEPGTVRVSAPGVTRWVEEAAEALVAGELILIDYPPAPDLPLGGVRTFSAHRRGDDPFDSPGEWDITLPVDWNAVSAAARSAGLEVMPLTSQAEWLGKLGIEKRLAAIREAELAALQKRDTMEVLRLKDLRIRASSLVDPEGLGAFAVFRAIRRV